jgi:hypothetical protein
MIRKMLWLFPVFIMLVSTAFAKKDKTISFKDSTLTDIKYSFTLNVSKNWKVKDFSEPSIERAFLQKKNYSVNREAQTYGGDYTIPTIVLFAQEFNGSLDDFEALLKKSLEEHHSDNQIIQQLGLQTDGEYITSGSIKLDSLPALQIVLKRNYKRLLATSAYGTQNTQATTETEKFINDHEVHLIYLVKKDSTLYVIQEFCEREFFPKENKDEFEAIANSLDFK